MQVLFAAVLIYALYKTVTAGVPAGFRAVRAAGGRRMAAWRDANPGASTPAILSQRLATWIAALRYGPGYVKREMGQAFVDAWAAGRDRYGLSPVRDDQGPDLVCDDQGPRYGNDPTDPTGTQSCPLCHGAVAVGGQVCPACLERQAVRNVDQPAIPRRSDGRPDLRRVPSQTNSKGSDMPIKTATGGEITSPETLLAEVTAIRDEALAEREDAAGDAVRADEDLARIELMVASLLSQKINFSSEDTAKVSVMKDSAAARKAAAVARSAAADLRYAQACAAVEVAAKHLQLQGQGAAGQFYRGSA
jgi:hypothetical protein